MNILYVTTILAIYVLFILMHKTEKKQNLIMWLTISIILILCYNVLVCTLFSFIGILCTLLNLSIINAVTVVGLLIVLFKRKKVQKYYFTVKDIVFSILLLITVIFIAYQQYGFPFNIKYDSSDASSHYFFANQFYNNLELLHKGVTEDIFDRYVPEFRLPGAYVNEGILFRVFDGIFLQTDLFIIFDLVVLYMSGILFYYLLEKYIKGNKILNVISIALALIYMLGYQLNSMLSGYSYLSLALDIVITLMLLISNYEKEEINNRFILPVLSLLSFGVFFSYGYFVPIIYISIIINTILKATKNNEEVTSMSNIKKLIIVIVIPLLLGMFYFLLLPVLSGRNSEISAIGRDGGIYQNYITNILVFIPILIIGLVIKRNKEKNIDFGTILFVSAIVFTILLLIGRQVKIVSNYYYFKAYFIIWPLIIYNVFIALSEILKVENKRLKIATYVYISVYILCIIIGLTLNKNIGINDVFHYNLKSISRETNILDREEIEVLENVQDLTEKQNLYVLTASGETPQRDRVRRWMYAICKNDCIFIDYLFSNQGDIERWLQGDRTYYLALYKNYNELQDNEDPNENSDEYRIIHKDEYSFILERK